MEKEFLESIDRKVDKLTDAIIELKIEQIEIKLDLREHMKRSAYAEERLDKFEDQVVPLLEKVKFTKWIFSGICFATTIILSYLKYRN